MNLLGTGHLQINTHARITGVSIMVLMGAYTLKIGIGSAIGNPLHRLDTCCIADLPKGAQVFLDIAPGAGRIRVSAHHTHC